MLPPDWKQQLLKVYPKRQGQGWVNTEKWITKHLEAGEDFEAMLSGANSYRRYIATSGEFVKMAQTFFGPSKFWLEFDDEDCANEVTLDDEAQQFDIKRQQGEGDEHLKKRLGVAMTKKQYG